MCIPPLLQIVFSRAATGLFSTAKSTFSTLLYFARVKAASQLHVVIRKLLFLTSISTLHLPFELQGCTVPQLKDLIHICLDVA